MQNEISEIVKFFFTLQLNIKMYHWNTTSFSRHKATDEFGGKLLSLIDQFVEVYIGRHKVKPSPSMIKISSELITDMGSEELLQKSKEYLERLNIKDSDLLTIRDEIVAEINQTLYLYQLK
jgi:DNA-binding ferritin-like protein